MFCNLEIHNKKFEKYSSSSTIPALSSDIYIFFNGKIVSSHSKQFPFSEMLDKIQNGIPDVYKNVFYL